MTRTRSAAEDDSPRGAPALPCTPPGLIAPKAAARFFTDWVRPASTAEKLEVAGSGIVVAPARDGGVGRGAPLAAFAVGAANTRTPAGTRRAAGSCGMGV